ncbi:uncharacterized protein EV154DRAFT_581876 [Mucor mucedo]|uniref:uncharacterized protein n=1 Tax=Mucor mucedo TaxID=29922 RepID=UPI00221FA9DC|nr:uncharacterized protein EV154DRAFT_581876 [Mucor mucedo]KAI7893696.1 hypothetical protein EV154DRAFT_581876 [Mucor mucedo]
MMAEQRVNNTALVPPFQPGQDITAWIKQFHLAAKALGMNNEGSRNMQLLKYLPQEATDWLLRVANLTSAKDVRSKLESVYGIDPLLQKTLCRRKLEALKQGTRRVAEYRMNFETIVEDFPESHTLPDDVLRHIFFANLRKTLATAAAIRESVLHLGNDHFLGAPHFTAPAETGPSEPTPMDIDVIQHQRRTNQGKDQDPMRRWAEDGQPICGHCNAIGHLTKKCRSQSNNRGNNSGRNQWKPKQVHGIDSSSPSTPAPLPTNSTCSTVRYVSSIDMPNYAVIPIDDDPVYTFPGVHSELAVVLTCHIVHELAHEVIIGYPDLKALCAVIDTASNEVRIPKAISGDSSGVPPSGVPVVAKVCSMATTLRLPGFHHAYVDIKGPANRLAFVSTPQDVTLEKLLSVAAGVVQFDSSGMATVKIANLNTTDVIINKGQHIASYEYLPSFFELHSISSKILSQSSPPSDPKSSPSTSTASLDFTPSICEDVSRIKDRE